MTRDDSRLEVARRWLVIAGRDLKAARFNVAEHPSNSVFLSQQCSEKAAKALLAAHGAQIRKIHDLKELGDECSKLVPHLARVLESVSQLSDYAVVFRYLDAPYDPDETEAADALARATALYDAVKSELGL